MLYYIYVILYSVFKIKCGMALFTFYITFRKIYSITLYLEGH